MDMTSLINVNIGILGHVDSGKTALCKALSTQGSTAAFDSNPQSKARGITLDLGFSVFPLKDKWSCTLVDCPGHASLIRTVLGGVQIMDLMLLVIDITKGMQPQTAECLILANITSPNLIVVLNKVDMIKPKERDAKVSKVMRLMKDTLTKTRFSDAPVVVASAIDEGIGLGEIRNAILAKLETITLKRDRASPFLIAIDHCFSVKGSGTVCTGTVLQGGIKVGDTVEFPDLQTSSKIKTMQKFKNPITEAWAGDRVTIGVPGIDPKRLERCIAAEPGLLTSRTRVVIIRMFKIPNFKEAIRSRQRYHVSIGYSTVTARLMLFKNVDETDDSFELGKHYNFIEEITNETESGGSSSVAIFAVLEYDYPAYMLPNSLVIGTNLQFTDVTKCRLAFHGTMLHSSQAKDYRKTYLPQIKIFTWKTKEGLVDRAPTDRSTIVRGLCSKMSNIEHLLDKQVTFTSNDKDNKAQLPKGRIEGRFGQTDKLRINLDTPLSEEQLAIMRRKGATVEITYKKFIFTEDGIEHKLFQ